MTRFRIFLVFLALLLPVSELAAQPRVRPLTKMDLYRLPEAEFQRRVLEQLTGSLYRSDNNPGLYRGVPKYPLERWISNTKPRATWSHDVCQSDQLYFQFDPIYVVDEDGGDAETPVTISSVKAQPYFRFISEPTKPRERFLDEQERFELNKLCAKLDPYTFFVADDEEVLSKGVNRYLQVMQEVRGGGLLTFPCFSDYKEAPECRKKLTEIGIFKNITNVSTCRPVDPSYQCSLIYFDVPDHLSVGLNIHWQLAASPAKEKIIRVELNELLTHATPWRW